MTAQAVFTHGHASGRFDRSLRLQAEEIDRMSKFPGMSITTHTEQSGDTEERDETFEHPGWDWWQSPRDRGHDEMVTRWKTAVWDLIERPETVQLSEMQWVRSPEYGGKTAAPVIAQHVPLVMKRGLEIRLSVISAHMPLANTDLRREIWIDCCRGGLVPLVRQIRREDKGRKILLTGDWNRDWRDRSERALIERELCRPLQLKQAWAMDDPKIGGTHGRQGLNQGSLIDGDLHNFRRGESFLMRDSQASDHRPYAVRYYL